MFIIAIIISEYKVKVVIMVNIILIIIIIGHMFIIYRILCRIKNKYVKMNLFTAHHLTAYLFILQIIIYSVFYKLLTMIITIMV